jgi:hypothetical protein
MHMVDLKEATHQHFSSPLADERSMATLDLGVHRVTTSSSSILCHTPVRVTAETLP